MKIHAAVGAALALSFAALAFAAPATAQETAPPPPPPPPAGEAATEEGRALLERAVKAHGGEALLKLKTLKAVGKGELTTPEAQGGLKVPLDVVTLTAAAPGRTRLDAETVFGPVTFAVPGKGVPAWYSLAGSVSDLPGTAATLTDPLAVLRAAASPSAGVTVRAFPVETGVTTPEGVALKAFEVTDTTAASAAGKPGKARVYVEAETGRMRRVDIQAGGAETVTLLSAYRTVGGVVVPTALQLRQKDREVLSLTFATVELDVAVDEKAFDRPAPPASAPAATTGGAPPAAPGGA
jgi:hypothetical protein